MKKLLVILSIFLLVGCELNNTPTKKIEQFLSNYQILHKDVISDLEGVINKTNYTGEQKEKYKELMKKQYKSLIYEIKEETIDGNKAYVTVQIEVTNYGKRLTETENYLNNISRQIRFGICRLILLLACERLYRVSLSGYFRGEETRDKCQQHTDYHKDYSSGGGEYRKT